jgi:hypothetical protein
MNKLNTLGTFLLAALFAAATTVGIYGIYYIYNHQDTMPVGSIVLAAVGSVGLILFGLYKTVLCIDSITDSE